MTVQELIQQLIALPPDTKLVVRGYEDGYNDILQLKKVSIKQNSNSYTWEGEYEDSNDTDALDAYDL
jgi:hypothetical protein